MLTKKQMTELCIMLIMLFQHLVVASTDADIFISLSYHFVHWISCGMEELWVLRGQAVPLHDLLRVLNPDAVSILPAALALTGCDTTSKVGTKKKVLHAVESCYGHLQTFGKVVLSDHMICQAEEFLLKCVSNDKAESFNNLRYIVYHKQSFGLDMVKLPPTSESIVLHIKRAYNVTVGSIPRLTKMLILISTDFGYVVDEDNNLAPKLLCDIPTPSDRLPYTVYLSEMCKKTVCPCSVMEIPCYEFCKCHGV